jgi:hypothetical protein
MFLRTVAVSFALALIGPMFAIGLYVVFFSG